MKNILLIISYLLVSLGQVNAQDRIFKLDAALRPGDYDPHTVVVKFRPSTAASARRAAPSASTHASLRKTGVKAITRLFPNQQAGSAKKSYVPHNSKALVDLSTIYQLQLPDSQNIEAAINTLLADPEVAYAEPVYTNFQPLYVPNDPLANPVDGPQYALRNIKAFQAWDVHKGSPDVTIGIVDFGFETTHDDLKNKIRYNTADPVDGIDNDKDGYIDNYAGWNIINNNNNLRGDNHGTRTAGCAAAEADNGIGIAGVAPNCRFLPVSGYDPATRRFSGFAGIVYLAEKGCKVINLSWGRPGAASFLEQDIMNYAAINHDVVITASAGNESSDLSRYWWPASYENVISVAATGPADLKWGTAGGSAYNDKIDIAAPGQDIISSIDGNGYSYDSGTSYSSPMVAGAAALVRSMYPHLSAAEVARRLVGTADDIYNLPGNSPYVGKLGSGRLNVYRALTEPVTKSVIPVDVVVKNAQNQPYLLAGIPNELIINLKNAASPLSNAQVRLVANSSYVAIANRDLAVGFVATDATISNTTAPFRITVNPAAPHNYEVTFTVIVTDGAYQRTFSWMTFINPDYLDIAINQTKVTATSNGRVGFAGAYSFWEAGIATNQQARGNGIRFGDKQLLFEAGLIVAADANRVSDCIRDQLPTYNRNQHFESVKNVAFQNYPLADVLAGGIIRESWSHQGRIGLEIQHQTYAWKDAPNDQFVIVEYKIKNKSGSRIDSLYTGLFADWEIGTRQNNRADWDAARKLGYVYNPNGSHPYAGVQLLTAQKPQYYAFDNQAGINIFDGFSAAEKFQAISSGTTRTQTTTATDDVAHLLAAQIKNLNNGDSVIVAFAMLAANSITDLQKTADAARQKFIDLNRSPKPVVPTVSTCRGGRVVIVPTPGQTFNFYQKQSDGSLRPLSAGRDLAVNNVKNDTTFFVTNADKLYESEPVPVTVRVFEAQFTVNKDSLGIFDKDVLQLNDQTAGAVQWAWDFGDGYTSTEQNPAHRYNHEGAYRVALVTRNEQGCQDTLVRMVRVFPGILSPDPVVSPVTVCRGDLVVIRPTNGTRFGFYNKDQRLIRYDSVLNAGRIYRDTTFYVTTREYLVESFLVQVNVTITPVKADFRVAQDTLDLTLNQTLQVDNNSTNAVQWYWHFGDGQSSTLPNPVHTYAQAGNYTVQLQVTNALGCTDTLSRPITVMRRSTQLAEGIHVYPNPTTDFVTIDRDLGLLENPVSMRVISSAGRQIFYTDNLTRSQLDLRPYGKGLYIVIFSGNSQQLTKKVVVN